MKKGSFENDLIEKVTLISDEQELNNLINDVHTKTLHGGTTRKYRNGQKICEKFEFEG